MKKKPYHLRVVFSPEEKEVVSQAIKNGLWKSDRLYSLMSLGKELARVNNIKAPAIIVQYDAEPRYDPQGVIVLNKPSLVTFLHQFVFHKFNGYVPPAFFEDYARAYSLGLFYAADPVAYKKAAKARRLFYAE